MHTWVVLDFETASACNLKKAGAWRYSEDPTTEILLLRYRVGSTKIAAWAPGDPIEPLASLASNPEIIFIAHGAGFEKAIWRNIMVPVFGFPDLPDIRWHDTMATCAMRALPLDLEDAANVLRLPCEKDMEGSRLTRGLSKARKDGSYDRTPETLARVGAYCDRDVEVETALFERLGWLPARERLVWLLDQRINQRGVRLDLDFVRGAQRLVDRASIPLEAEFSQITGGLKIGQRDKIILWCRDNGVVLPNMQKETLARLLGEEDEDAEYDPGALIVTLPPHVHRALSIRSLIGSASIKKLKTMDLCVCSDGRARGLLQYHAATPGRWGGRLIQPQNFPRGSLDRKALEDAGVTIDVIVRAIKEGDPEFLAMLTGSPPIESLLSSLRNALIPADDREYIVGDFSTVELRVNLGLAGQDDKIEMLRKGLDPYIDMAMKIYKRPLNKKDNPEERQTGKNSVLGLGFQMGWRKFQFKYAKEHPDEFCQEIVRIFREEWAPKIKYNWWDLEEAALRAVMDGTPQEARGVTYQREDAWLTARLPSGRKLWYFNPRTVRKRMPWDDTDIRLAWTYNAMKQGKLLTIDAYGGLLTENVVQALARDLLVNAMFKCEKENLPVVLTVHDELVTEPKAGHATAKMLEQIMTDIPDWAKAMKLPIAAECWQGNRYRK